MKLLIFVILPFLFTGCASMKYKAYRKSDVESIAKRYSRDTTTPKNVVDQLGQPMSAFFEMSHLYTIMYPISESPEVNMLSVMYNSESTCLFIRFGSTPSTSYKKYYFVSAKEDRCSFSKAYKLDTSLIK